MTTTELIKLLKDNEFGGVTGKPRVISVRAGKYLYFRPEIVVNGAGDGCYGPAEIDLVIQGEGEYCEEDEERDRVLSEILDEVREIHKAMIRLLIKR